MLMNSLHRGLNQLWIQGLIIPHLRRFSCKRHWRICSLNCKEWCAFCWFRYPIICSKLSQGEPLYLIILLIIHEYSQGPFHTCFLPLFPTIPLRLKCCRHSSKNPQMTTSLAPKSWSKLRAPIWNDFRWQHMDAYNFSEEQLRHPYRIDRGMGRNIMLLFEGLSSTTQLASIPSHSGNHTTKSIEVSSHGFSRTGNIQTTPDVECRELHDRWHFWQFRTYLSTSLRLAIS